MANLEVSILLALGTALVALLGLSGLVVSFHFHPRVLYLRDTIDKIASLRYRSRTDVTKDLLGLFERYRTNYYPPRVTVILVRMFSVLSATTAVFSFAMATHMAGLPWEGWVAIGVLSIVLSLLVLWMWGMSGHSARRLGLDLPNPESLDGASTLSRVANVRLRDLLRQCQLTFLTNVPDVAGVGPEVNLYLEQLKIYLHGIWYIFFLQNTRLQGPGLETLDRTILIGLGKTPPFPRRPQPFEYYAAGGLIRLASDIRQDLGDTTKLNLALYTWSERERDPMETRFQLERTSEGGFTTRSTSEVVTWINGFHREPLEVLRQLAEDRDGYIQFLRITPQVRERFHWDGWQVLGAFRWTMPPAMVAPK